MHNTCDGCVGCVVESSCLGERIDDGEHCPCANCLIKVMCSTGCKEFFDYYGGVVGSLKKEGINIEWSM